jgi:hypothetical protein
LSAISKTHIIWVCLVWIYLSMIYSNSSTYRKKSSIKSINRITFTAP